MQITVYIITLLLFSAISLLSSSSMHSVFALNKSVITNVNVYNKIANNRNVASVDFDSVVKRIEMISTNNSNTQTMNLSNPEVVLVDNQSAELHYGLPSYWNYSSGNCNAVFKCIKNFTSGWKDNTSFQLSTNTTNKNTWSGVNGDGFAVAPQEKYELVTHMQLNKFVLGSHIPIQGYNTTSKSWYQITQCPSGTNGPLEWHAYSCEVRIPSNTTKIRPVLNAGWSSQPGKQAVTLFDAIYLIKQTDICIDYKCMTFAPIINDPSLNVQLVYKGLETATTMAFLGPNDFLVLEKEGKVQRIVNGVELKQPLLNVAVARQDGLLGIAILKPENQTLNLAYIQTKPTTPTTYVFLYYTQSGGGTSSDDLTEGIKPKCNCLYRYELVNNKLINPKLLLNLPAYPGPEDNGGIVKIGPDNNVYVVVGSVLGEFANATRDKALNFADGPDPDGRAGILRVTVDGKPVGKGIIGETLPLNLYYAYGIRNSFGIGFDPISKNLWETENGPSSGDEINLVEPGFNSGWARMTGIWQVNEGHEYVNFKNTTIPNDLVTFGGKGKYRSPEFTWNQTVAPTSIIFLNSDKLGKQYQNDMFVADANHGNIYDFKLNQNRTALVLNGAIANKVASNEEQLQGLIFATGFGPITDLEVGPDGYLYVVAEDENSVYRIVPTQTHMAEESTNHP